jgi:hypothetical protein
MYRISRNDCRLLVEFEDDFNYHDLRMIFQQEILAKGCSCMDIILLVGRHHALIGMGELLSVVDDFGRLCQACANKRKTAVVVDQGLTESIMKLMADGIDQQHPIKSRVFHDLDEAKAWLEVTESKVV